MNLINTDNSSTKKTKLNLGFKLLSLVASRVHIPLMVDFGNCKVSSDPTIKLTSFVKEFLENKSKQT